MPPSIDPIFIIDRFRLICTFRNVLWGQDYCFYWSARAVLPYQPHPRHYSFVIYSNPSATSSTPTNSACSSKGPSLKNRCISPSLEVIQRCSWSYSLNRNIAICGSIGEWNWCILPLFGRILYISQQRTNQISEASFPSPFWILTHNVCWRGVWCGIIP